MLRQGERGFESGVLFHDRLDAGDVLAGLLKAHHTGEPVVLGIARGGVIVAAEVARRLDADLDVVVARKIGAPRAPEVELGAVSAGGGLCLHQAIIRQLAVPAVYLDAVVASQMDEARRREAHLRGGRPEPALRGRSVVLVDDGLATGAAIIAAARSARLRHPARLVAAAPVGSREACLALAGEVDEIVCPYVPEPFESIAASYERFESVHDALVERVLREWGGTPGGARAGAGSLPASRSHVTP
jgi:putative phosphoribosyl transferase